MKELSQRQDIHFPPALVYHCQEAEIWPAAPHTSCGFHYFCSLLLHVPSLSSTPSVPSAPPSDRSQNAKQISEATCKYVPLNTCRVAVSAAGLGSVLTSAQTFKLSRVQICGGPTAAVSSLVQRAARSTQHAVCSTQLLCHMLWERHTSNMR